MREGQIGQAVEDYGEAIRLDPHNSLTYNNRGATYDDLGQHERAVDLGFDGALLEEEIERIKRER